MIRNSQGVKIQESGTYQTTRLPTEPLAIARTSHCPRLLLDVDFLFADYLQRDLSDCHQVSLLHRFVPCAFADDRPRAETG